MKLRLFQCNICGKIILVLSDTEVPTYCCGQSMAELVPNHTDGAYEKHVPVFRTDGTKVSVRVGSTAHPMTDAHSITWIGLSTAHGLQFRTLRPGDNPEASFFINPEDSVKAVYAYCSLHGLWISDTEGVNYHEK